MSYTPEISPTSPIDHFMVSSDLQLECQEIPPPMLPPKIDHKEVSSIMSSMLEASSSVPLSIYPSSSLSPSNELFSSQIEASELPESSLSRGIYMN